MGRLRSAYFSVMKYFGFIILTRSVKITIVCFLLTLRWFHPINEQSYRLAKSFMFDIIFITHATIEIPYEIMIPRNLTSRGIYAIIVKPCIFSNLSILFHGTKSTLSQLLSLFRSYDICPARQITASGLTAYRPSGGHFLPALPPLSRQPDRPSSNAGWLDPSQFFQATR